MKRSSPDASALAAELQRLAHYGVGRAMGELTEDDLPQLAATARQLAPDPPRERLRVSIAIAVERAVAMIDPPKHAEAARRLLWLPDSVDELDDDKSRKRKPLSARHPEVAALLGYSLTTYERYKKWSPIYRQIAANLLRMLSSTVTIVPAPDNHGLIERPGDSDFEHECLVCAARAGAGLHYAAMTSLFVAHLHNQCVSDARLQAEPLYPWDNAASWLFDNYACLNSAVLDICAIFSQSHELETIDNGHSPATEGNETIDKTTMERLSSLLYLVEMCGPRARDSATTEAVAMYGELLERGHKDRSVSYYQDVKPPDDLDFEWTTTSAVYDTSWLPWYKAQFGIYPVCWPPATDERLSDRQLRPVPISVMAMLGLHVVTTVEDRRPVGQPVLSQSRARALRLISTFYDADDWRPLSFGGSLRDNANYFFDTLTAQLVKQLPVSYDDRDGWKKIEAVCSKIDQEWNEASAKLSKVGSYAIS